jgi:hypothetical protein
VSHVRLTWDGGVAAPAAAFDADLAKLGELFQRCGAIITCADGWQGIDPAKAPPDALRAYDGLVAYGFANGYLR